MGAYPSNWPARSTDRFTRPWDAKTQTAMILLSNKWDSATSLQNAQAAEQRLGNAMLLTENGYGHLTLNDPQHVRRPGRTRYLIDLLTHRDEPTATPTTPVLLTVRDLTWAPGLSR